MFNSLLGVKNYFVNSKEVFLTALEKVSRIDTSLIKLRTMAFKSILL